jgi:hypothetical protein
VAHHLGGSLAVGGWTAFLELLETTDDANTWYTNHTVYGPGSYFYRGYVMGHPFGPDARGGQIKIWSPPFAGQRVQAWVRTREHRIGRHDELLEMLGGRCGDLPGAGASR